MAAANIKPTRVEIPIEPRDQNGYALEPHDIKVHVEGPTRVDAILEKKGAGVVLVFTTTITGEYSVHLTHGGKHIVHSPFTVNVSPKQGSSGSEQAPVLPSTKKTVVRFAVDAVDGKGSQIPATERLEIECEGPEQVAPKVERDGNKILISFETNIRQGEFSVGILHNGKHIHRSPFGVSVTPTDSQRNLEYDDVPVATLPAANRVIQFTVKAKTKALASVDARDCAGEIIFGEEGSPAVKIENSGNDLLVSFAAHKAGKHKISIKQGGADILGSPFKIDVPVEAIYG